MPVEEHERPGSDQRPGNGDRPAAQQVKLTEQFREQSGDDTEDDGRSQQEVAQSLFYPPADGIGGLATRRRLAPPQGFQEWPRRVAPSATTLNAALRVFPGASVFILKEPYGVSGRKCRWNTLQHPNVT